MNQGAKAKKIAITAAIAPLLMVLIFCAQPGAEAGSNNFILDNGSGEKLSVKNSLIGGQSTSIKDRLGDTIEKKNGWFGSNSTKVKVLGNSYETKKSWFGQKTTTATTLLGDKIETKKGWFGRRRTTIDVSGTSKLIGNLLSKSKTPPTNSGNNNQAGLASRNQAGGAPFDNQDNYNPNPVASNNGFATH